MDICGQNSAVSNMCRCAENALKGHTVSELPNQPSKHIHQLTSSASFLTKVQATTEPHTLFQQREKGSILRPAKETRNHEKQIYTNEHHRNTQRRIQLSLSPSIKHSKFQRVLQNGGSSPCCDRQTQEKQTATRECPRCCKKKKPVTRNIFPQRNVQPC